MRTLLLLLLKMIYILICIHVQFLNKKSFKAKILRNLYFGPWKFLILCILIKLKMGGFNFLIREMSKFWDRS